jgi:predicted ATPase
LNAHTVLFFDEPETTLHPEAIRSLMDMVLLMAKAGIQVFMATHNYFVIKQLAISSLKDDVKVLCLNLQRGENGISCDTTELKDGILPENDIITESLEMMNDELKMQFT